MAEFSGSGALGGAATGAAIGAPAGPYGALIGGAIGGIGGGLGLFGGGGKADVSQEQFDLPGFEERQQRLRMLQQQLGGRTGPQLGTSGFRGGQAGLIRMLQEQARGGGPSLAKQQLQEGLRRNVATQQALLASGRPGGQAGQARAASQQASQAAGALAGQGAQARIAEIMGARSQLGGALGQARGQDLQRAISQGQMDLRGQSLQDQMMLGLLQQELMGARAQQQGAQGYQGFLAQQPSTLDQLLAGGTAMAPLLAKLGKGGGGGDQRFTSEQMGFS